MKPFRFDPKTGKTYQYTTGRFELVSTIGGSGSGTKGDKGDMGPRGPAGAKGSTGDTGPAGADGSTGFISALNPDDGQYYNWVPREGDIDPVSGDPTIVGEWVLTVTPALSSVALENPDDGLFYRWEPRNGDIDPVTGLPTIVGVWVPI